MFYNSSDTGFIITSVYRVTGLPRVIFESGRKHTALSIRLRGNSKILCDDKEYHLKNGSLAYFPAGVDYQRITESEEKYIAIHLTVFSECENSIVALDHCENLYPIFDTICSEWEKYGARARNRCMSLLYRAFDKIEKSLEEKKNPPPDIIAAGVEHLQKEFRSKNLTIASLAEKCHVSEAYFRRIYHAHFGISPMQELLELRFDFAKSLLRSGYYQIKQIAEMSGFSDVKYFRTAFKKRFGVTPSQYSDGKKA
ncbi:MAG: helix-turn-helix transcriptional regulator [Clostridia bacterium]|nr:helix-turn-helix transcriptional regulator [Clostridia bacterium]